MSSHDTSLGMGNGIVRGGLFVGILLVMWLGYLFLTSDWGPPARKASAPAAASTPLPQEAKVPDGPWKSKDKSATEKQATGGVRIANVADATPQLDAWLEKNWNQDDEKLIDGLLGFAAEPEKPEAERTAALTHALNLLPDKDYMKLGGLLEAPGTPQVLLQQVLADMHNRSEAAAIRAGVKLLRRTEPEIQKSARELLAFLVDLDAESDLEAIRLQADTRIIELEEQEKDTETKELPPEVQSPPADFRPPAVE